MTSRTLAVSLVALGTLLSASAFAGPAPLIAPQPVSYSFDLTMDALAAEDDEESDDSGEDDALDDILNDSSDDESSVAEEKRAVKEGRVDAKVGADDEALALANERRGEKRTIKVLQRKNFQKIGRWEFGPHLGFLTNDPFTNRYLVGVNGGYHITEVFSVEGAFTFSPDFGQADWKPITQQLVNNNKVSPDISKLIWVANATTQFSPIYGKIAVTGGKIIVFDVYGIFGFGLAGTQDDMDALQCDDQSQNDPCAVTANQMHPTSTMGGGIRVAFSKRFATRVEGRTLFYVETLNGTSLEMKQNFLLQASTTFFFDASKK
jgi:outer membrane beta-barrel protein